MISHNKTVALQLEFEEESIERFKKWCDDFAETTGRILQLMSDVPALELEYGVATPRKNMEVSEAGETSCSDNRQCH